MPQEKKEQVAHGFMQGRNWIFEVKEGISEGGLYWLCPKTHYTYSMCIKLFTTQIPATSG